MKVAVLGSGGREHALIRALWRSKSVEHLVSIPGNPGTAETAKSVCFDPGDFDALRKFVRKERIDLVVPGSESLIAAGVADLLAREATAVFAPDKEAGKLESSKAFASEFRTRYGVPQPRYAVVDRMDEALDKARDFLSEFGGVAVKADGLAAGKGVVVARDWETARKAIREALVDRRFGNAGRKLVLEELIDGEEISILALVDGVRIVPLLPSQDYKKLRHGNTGPNTGGMGAYAPVPWCDHRTMDEIRQTILEPTLRGIQAEGFRFRGVLYAGLILSPRGLLVLEYNVRFGDPETQAVLSLLESDLGELMLSACRGSLPPEPLSWKDGAAVCVILASAGYPRSSSHGDPIDGLSAAQNAGAIVDHAGTKIVGGRLVTAGGRVLGVTALGPDLLRAADRAHEAAARILFHGKQMRNDIGRVGNSQGASKIGPVGSRNRVP